MAENMTMKSSKENKGFVSLLVKYTYEEKTNKRAKITKKTRNILGLILKLEIDFWFITRTSNAAMRRPIAKDET